MTRYYRVVECHGFFCGFFWVSLYFPLLCSTPPPLVLWFQRVAGGVAVLLLMMHGYCQKYAWVPLCGFMHTIFLSLKCFCVNTVMYCTQIYAYCKWDSLKFSCFSMNLKATTLNLYEYNSYFYVHAFRFVGTCSEVLKRCHWDKSRGKLKDLDSERWHIKTEQMLLSQAPHQRWSKRCVLFFIPILLFF